MVHKMNKQCEQKSNAELSEEVVPGATEGRKSPLLPYHTLFTGHGKLSVYWIVTQTFTFYKDQEPSSRSRTF